MNIDLERLQEKRRQAYLLKAQPMPPATLQPEEKPGAPLDAAGFYAAGAKPEPVAPHMQELQSVFNSRTSAPAPGSKPAVRTSYFERQVYSKKMDKKSCEGVARFLSDGESMFADWPDNDEDWSSMHMWA